MRNNIAYLTSRGGLIVAAALIVVFLIPVVAKAQQDAKGAEIAKLKEIADSQKVQIERLVKEIDALNKALSDRDKSILKLENVIKAMRLEAVQREAQLRGKGIQNESPKAINVTPTEPNPPAELVNGKIEKIDGDLVQINLGNDHGVNRGHTLEVYRLAPQPKYVGMIRIVDATHAQAVGRLVVLGNGTRPDAKVSDLVTSKIAPAKEKK